MDRINRARETEGLHPTNEGVGDLDVLGRGAEHGHGLRLEERPEGLPGRHRRVPHITRGCGLCGEDEAGINRDRALGRNDDRVQVGLRDLAGEAHQQPVFAAERQHSVQKRLFVHWGLAAGTSEQG